MDDEDPRIDELDREIRALRARIDELEAETKAAYDRGWEDGYRTGEDTGLSFGGEA
jgi:hypothetical protein